MRTWQLLLVVTVFVSFILILREAPVAAPVAAQYALGKSLGIRGTPAIVTSTGQMIPGYKPADELEQLLGLN